MSELITELTAGAKLLADSSFNPVSLTAGVELLLRFVTLQRPSGHQDFKVHKQNLVVRAKEFMAESHRCVEKVVSLASSLIKDDAVSQYMYVDCERTTDLLWHSTAFPGNNDALVFSCRRAISNSGGAAKETLSSFCDRIAARRSTQHNYQMPTQTTSSTVRSRRQDTRPSYEGRHSLSDYTRLCCLLRHQQGRYGHVGCRSLGGKRRVCPFRACVQTQRADACYSSLVNFVRRVMPCPSCADSLVQIGSSQMAMIAKAADKPVYALAER